MNNCYSLACTTHNRVQHRVYNRRGILPSTTQGKSPSGREDLSLVTHSKLYTTVVEYCPLYTQCKGDWGTRLQENPQLILRFVIMIQLTFKRILRDQDKAPGGIFYIIYQVYILCVRVSVIGAILVCLSITLVILEQAQVAPEHCYTVQGQKQGCPLTPRACKGIPQGKAQTPSRLPSKGLT